MVEINWNPDARTLRWFAGLQVVFFCVIACIWRATLGPTGITLLLLASVLATVVGFVRPAWIRPVYVGWMVAVFPIGWVMSHVLLAVIYFVVLTPIALLVRWRRGDPLHRQFDAAAPTYWTPRRPAENTERYFRQY